MLRFCLFGLGAFLATMLVADTAKAGDCRRVEQVVVQEYVAQPVVQKVVVQRVYAQPQQFVMQRQFVQSGYGYGAQGFSQRQSFRGGRQSLGGGDGRLGNLIEFALPIAGAAVGAGVGGPFGAAVGAGAGQLIGGFIGR